MSRWFRTYGYADVLDDLLIGAYPLDEEDVARLADIGVERVVNLVEEAEYSNGERDDVRAAYAAAGIVEHRVVFADYGRLPEDQLEVAVEEVLEWLDEGRRVYLHCRAGWQRSAAVAAGVVAITKGLEITDALAYVRVRKPNADPLPHQREDLVGWWNDRGE
jgi:atypical dual specificity phosphatase